MPLACHTFSIKEKISFCQCLHHVKVPQRYSSNIKSLVQFKDLKLVGLIATSEVVKEVADKIVSHFHLLVVIVL